MAHSLRLADLQRIKQWHVAHKRDHPLEYHLWDGVLCLWLMGWVGWLPALALQAFWAFPVCLLAMHTPGLYIRWRAAAHQARRLRCDWLVP